MPDDWCGDVMGTLVDVRQKISACLSPVDWSDPYWGVHEGNGFTFEFNIGCDDPCRDIMVHVRGGGDAASSLVMLSERWGWYMLDTSQGEWLHHCDDLNAGWARFQAYRDHAIGGDRPTEP